MSVRLRSAFGLAAGAGVIGLALSGAMGFTVAADPAPGIDLEGMDKAVAPGETPLARAWPCGRSSTTPAS